MLPCQVARNVKVQAVAATGISHVIRDLVCGDRLIAQITPNACPVACVDLGREHERQSTIAHALQHSGA
jgi:hypothetical protein